MSVSLAAFGDLNEAQLLSLARVSETAERYEDMCTFMSALVKAKSEKGTDLEVEERNLLSVAYKNVVGSKRASWRTLGVENLEEVGGDKTLQDNYKQKVEVELETIIQDVLQLLEKQLLPNVQGKKDETEVFYLKMCGDYYRYLAEFRPNSGNAQSAEKFYGQALEIANGNLAETHPTRLGLALNFSVCYYEILKNPDKACALAKEAFDAAIEKLDTLNDACYKDSTLIMQLLRDNLTLWTSEANADADDEQQD